MRPCCRLALLTPLLSLGLVACPTTGFECGVPLEDDQISRCNRGTEVCVCETRSCAEHAPTDECASGLRYVERPFAHDGLDRRCVPLSSASWIIQQSDDSQQCLSGTGGADGNGQGGAHQ